MKTELDKLDQDGRNPQHPPSMPFWKMVPGADGGSTIEQQTLEDFVRQSVSGDAAPIWMRQFQGEVKAVWFNVLPVGWVGEWHPSPALQWVVPLSGAFRHLFCRAHFQDDDDAGQQAAQGKQHGVRHAAHERCRIAG